MTSPRLAPPPDPSGWSLERRLPLLILTLLACVVGAFSVAAYREVRASAISRATERLERSARELATGSARTNQVRVGLLRALDTSATFVEALRTGGARPAPPLDRAAAVPVTREPRPHADRDARIAALLESSRSSADSTLDGWELWTLDGERRFPASSTGDARDSVALAVLRAGMTATTDSALRSPLYAVGRAVHVLTAVPVRVGGRTIGVLAERRRVANSAQAAETIRRLIGDDVDVLLSSRGAGAWASLRGEPVDPPFVESLGEDSASLLTARDGGARYYVVQALIPGTPWHVVLMQARDSVLARPREHLRRLLAVGAALLLLGTVGAWLVGRHVARPLRRVTDAAAALTAGDFAQRVPVAGAAEVAGLASTFNAMAAGLGDAHATLEERNLALERANEAKGQFLAMMSHELRTPLNAIGGYAELLELGIRGPVTPAQAEDLGRIRRSKDHLLAVISDILTFARAEAGALPLAIAPLSVADAFRNAAEMIAPQFQAKGVRLIVADVPPATAVRADEEKLCQVLLNLLSNALKFTDVEGEVALGCTSDDGVVRLEVRDTGIGIPPERLDDIFAPFVQVDGSLTRRVGGTGLGLAIARHLTTAMDGELTVESEPRRGSRFVVCLPAADVPRMDADDGARDGARDGAPGTTRAPLAVARPAVAAE